MYVQGSDACSYRNSASPLPAGAAAAEAAFLTRWGSAFDNGDAALFDLITQLGGNVPGVTDGNSGIATLGTGPLIAPGSIPWIQQPASVVLPAGGVVTGAAAGGPGAAPGAAPGVIAINGGGTGTPPPAGTVGRVQGSSGWRRPYQPGSSSAGRCSVPTIRPLVTGVIPSMRQTPAAAALAGLGDAAPLDSTGTDFSSLFDPSNPAMWAGVALLGFGAWMIWGKHGGRR